MRRILLLITDLQRGGTPTVVRELAWRLAREPATEIHVACLDRWGPVADQLRQRGVAVTALGACGAADLRAIWRLIRLINRERIDTVLSFLVHANAAAAVASLVIRHVRFLQSIQTTQRYPTWHWTVQSVASHAAERILVPSRSAGAAARQWANVPEEKIVVIANAVDAAEFSHCPASAGPGGRVGFVGRLDPVKRVGDLVEALGRLGPEVTLDIFGEGRDRRNICAAIERLQLGARVRLRGAIDAPGEALRQIDLLVLPSEAEGFGLVLIEAMAAGVPVIGTQVPGIIDVIENGTNGLLVPPANPGALAEAIRRVLDDPQLRQRLIAGGKQAVQDRFTWDRIYKQYRAVLGIDGSA